LGTGPFAGGLKGKMTEEEDNHITCSQCGRTLLEHDRWYEPSGEPWDEYSELHRCPACEDAFCDDCFEELETCDICGEKRCNSCFKSAEEVGGGLNVFDTDNPPFVNICYECAEESK